MPTEAQKREVKKLRLLRQLRRGFALTKKPTRHYKAVSGATWHYELNDKEGKLYRWNVPRRWIEALIADGCIHPDKLRLTEKGEKVADDSKHYVIYLDAESFKKGIEVAPGGTTYFLTLWLKEQIRREWDYMQQEEPSPID